MCRLSTNALTTTGEKQILLSPSSTASLEPSTMSPSDTLPALPTGAGPAMIAKSLQVKGEVICSGWLYIDGKVEGAISLPGGRVTVGRYALVAANISAREVVILGDVCGNIDASDRVDIRGESSLIGNVTTQRIRIDEGATSRAAWGLASRPDE